MPDISPNMELENKRREVRVKELLFNLDKMDLRQMELQAEIAKLEENKVATLQAIEKLKEASNGF